MSIVSILGLFEPMEWLTVGLVFFAGTQAIITVRGENAKKRDRQDESDLHIDLASVALQTEWYRVWAVATEWGQRDLFADIDSGVFDPQEILPADRATSIRGLARLGSTTAYLAQTGFIELERASRTARELVALVRKCGRGGVAGTAGSLIPAAHNTEANELLKAVRQYAMEAANALQDAVEHSPRHAVARKIELRDTLHSTSARMMKEKYDPPKDVRSPQKSDA